MQRIMAKKLAIQIWIFLFLCLNTVFAYADDGLGQTVQITTRLHSFVGKPTWVLIIHDLDHNQNIPYLFDIRKGENFWVAFTYSKNYVITASNLRISTYRSRFNKYRTYEIKNFCHLESHGRINRGESMFVTIKGNLFPCDDSYTCCITKYPDTHFTIVNQS